MSELQKLKEIIVKEVVFSLINEINNEVMPRIEALEKRVEKLEALVKSTTIDTIKTIVSASLEYHEKSTIPQIVREAVEKSNLASQVMATLKSSMDKMNVKFTEIDSKITSLSAKVSEVIESTKKLQESLETHIGETIKAVNTTNSSLKDITDRLNKLVITLRGLLNEIEGLRNEVERLSVKR